VPIALKWSALEKDNPMLRLLLLTLLLLLAACQPTTPDPAGLCVQLAAAWGSPTTATPPEDLRLLGTLPTGDTGRYTLHYSPEQGSVWVWYFYDGAQGFCGPYRQALTKP
jgi:hypothetical protein